MSEEKIIPGALVVALQNLRKEYENAMLNEDLDSYDDLLDAVKSVLVEAGFPPLIHDERQSKP